MSALTMDKNGKNKEARLREYVSAINAVYAISRDHLTLQAVLERALDVLFAVPCLDILSKGGVYLRDPEDDNQLVLVCSHGLRPEIDKQCAKIKFGECLCGQAAVARKIVLGSCVSARNEVITDGHGLRGQYSIPIMIGEKLVGVLVIYLHQSTRENRKHEKFLTEFAHALGVLIGFKQREEELVAKEQKARAAANIAEEALLRAQHAEQAKNSFLSTMSHELRTPMNGIVGMLHALNMGNLDAQQREYVELALSSSDLMLSIINDILDTTKLDHSAITLENQPICLQAFLDETQATFAPLVGEKKLRFQVCMEGDLPEYIGGDKKRLHQVLNNFISNAVKFTPRGSITLSIARQENQDNTDAPDWIIFKVTDTGIGISKDTRQIIFDRFTQVDSSITRQYGGTGLGLFICTELAQTMGGEVGVDSVPGQGSTFWCKIPYISAHIAMVDAA
ncbi:MAG: ATP-binding protein [Robiginitomaculum sp.]|nr:ATP-binding protein [Robiginitomaculum sp.]MDQ7078092.1 ATP-binding protein [Robiginitomaculum sp.]